MVRVLPFVLAACTSATLPVDQAAPPVPMVGEAPSCVVQGDDLLFTVNGPANAPVALMATSRANGPLYCPSALNGTCTDLRGSPVVLNVARTDASGQHTFSVRVPNLPASVTGYLQAVALSAGDVHITEVAAVNLAEPNPSTGNPADILGAVYTDPATGRHYQSIELADVTSWEDADALAASMNLGCQTGHLVTITSQAEQDVIAANVPLASQSWIGLRRTTTGWAWSNGEPFAYESWSPGEPDDANGIEDYGEIWGDGGWKDTSAFRRHLIVEYDDLTPTLDASTGNYLLRIDEPLSFEEARAAAETAEYQGLSGHLVTITSAEEQAMAAEVADGVRAWIGAYQDTNSPDFSEPAGGWRWVTSEPFVYTAWAPGEPNETVNLGEDAAELRSADSTWNDVRPIAALSYMIEFEPATCTDGLWNQGEERVDCGGPCAQSCAVLDVDSADLGGQGTDATVVEGAILDVEVNVSVSTPTCEDCRTQVIVVREEAVWDAASSSYLSQVVDTACAYDGVAGTAPTAVSTVVTLNESFYSAGSDPSDTVRLVQTLGDDCDSERSALQNGGVGLPHGTELGTVDTSSAAGLFELRHIFSGLCVDMPASTQVVGEDFATWACTGNPNQSFALLDEGEGWYSLQIQHSGQCLDVTSVSTANQARLQQFTCQSSSNQEFKLKALRGGHSLIMRHSGSCVDIEFNSTSLDAAVWQWGCNGAPAQIFELRRAAASCQQVCSQAAAAGCAIEADCLSDCDADLVTCPTDMQSVLSCHVSNDMTCDASEDQDIGWGACAAEHMATATCGADPF